MTVERHETIDEFLNRVRQAWDAGDARTYSELFTEDASYVIFLGDAILGRAQIAETHHDVFTKWQKGTRMTVKPITVHPVDDTVMVVLTAGGIGKGNKIAYDKFQTYTLRSCAGRYECVAFQNTEMSRRAKKVHGEQTPVS